MHKKKGVGYSFIVYKYAQGIKQKLGLWYCSANIKIFRTVFLTHLHPQMFQKLFAPRSCHSRAGCRVHPKVCRCWGDSGKTERQIKIWMLAVTYRPTYHQGGGVSHRHTKRYCNRATWPNLPLRENQCKVIGLQKQICNRAERGPTKPQAQCRGRLLASLLKSCFWGEIWRKDPLCLCKTTSWERLLRRCRR